VHKGYEYSRSGNPTRAALETCLASLEGGRHGLAFGSGLAATDCVMHWLDAGDHVVVMEDAYGGTYRLFRRVYERVGLRFSFVDATDLANVEAAFEPRTRLVWLESPTNPLLKLVDIAGLAALAHERHARVAVDNTFMSPYFQRPLELGADVVVHSATKYLGGHSDVMGGVPGPFDAWLVMRGLKTLALRMREHERNALAIASYLTRHPRVQRVHYPGLESHPQHALARRQMHGFGGMVTAILKGTLVDARRFLERCQIFALAESLGGVESLIEHPAIMTHASLPPEKRAALGIGDGLVRLSVGVEDEADLIADLEQALA